MPEALPEPALEEEKPSLSVGVGVRAGAAFDSDGKPADPTVGPATNAGLRADQINVRPYFSGQVTDYLAFEGNLDAIPNQVYLLDAVVKLQLHELFNVWMGQFLPPSSRANLSGPYFQNAWNYPLFVQGFPFDVAGRDRGLAFWGQVGEGMFKYQVGLFDLEPGNSIENTRLAGRLVLNLLEPEPGYYNSSTYYGAKDIFAIGATLQTQTTIDMDVDGDGEIDDAGMLGLQFDVLFEKNLDASGVLSLEGSFWTFDTDGAPGDDAMMLPAMGAFANPVNAGPPIFGTGQSFFVLAAWMTAEPVGVGHLQPNARLQWNKPDGGDGEMLIDGGLNYIIDGHNTRMHLILSHNTASEGTAVQAGTQIQMW